MSKESHLFRRLFHLFIPFYLVYYLVPDTVFTLKKEWITLMILAGFVVFELIRIKNRWVFFGIRDYEANQIAAFAWAAIAIVLALVFFPGKYAGPCIVGLGIGDPLIGEMKKGRIGIASKGSFLWYFCYPAVPATIYACIMLVGQVPLNMIPLATFLGIWGESFKIKYVDDNFTMIMIPLIGLVVVEWLTGLVV